MKRVFLVQELIADGVRHLMATVCADGNRVLWIKPFEGETPQTTVVRRMVVRNGVIE